MADEKPDRPASKPGQIYWRADTPSREIARELIERWLPKREETEQARDRPGTADELDHCPQCGSTEWIPIVYGMPAGDMFDAAQRGEVAIGGCVIFPEQPDVECRACSTQYRTKFRIEDEDDDWSDDSEN